MATALFAAFNLSRWIGEQLTQMGVKEVTAFAVAYGVVIGVNVVFRGGSGG